MVAIAFPASSKPGQKSQEGAGRLINCFADDLRGKQIIHRRVPGLRNVATSEETHTRGFIAIGSTLIWVLDDRAVSVTKSGSSYTVTDRGALDGTLPVTIARNNKSPTPDIVAVTENGTFNLFTGSAPTSFADGDLPSVLSVCFLGGYFIFVTGSGEIWASDLNDISVASNSFTTAESRPDSLLRGVAFRNELFAMGSESIEVYSNEGTSPFPLAFRLMIPRGLIGTWAVAGWEPGWSNELIWVGDDGVVYRLNGYTPEKISHFDIDRDIAGVSDKETLEAHVYMKSGHAFWALSSPTWTWVYDLTVQEWHERASYLGTRWRASQSVRAFDEWLAGDRETGKLFRIDETYYQEDGDPLVFEARSVPVQQFPARLHVPRMDFDFVPGVGRANGSTPNEIAPQVEISWTDDGGYNWSTPLLRQLGGQGDTRARVTVLRTGMTGVQGRQVRLKISDPCHVGLMGGAMAVDGRAE